MTKHSAITAVLTIALLSGCSGVRSSSVVPVQSKDKQLTCKEILLDINEAEQYKAAAEKNKNPGVRSFLAPLGYVYTLTSANEAIEASNKRIAYLQDVYQISGCTSGASGLSDEQLRGHTFQGGFPTPSPLQQRSGY